MRRRNFGRAWCRTNLCKRKIKDDKHLLKHYVFHLLAHLHQTRILISQKTQQNICLQLADTYNNNNKSVGILVGLDYFYNFITRKTIEGSPKYFSSIKKLIWYLYFADQVELIQRNEASSMTNFVT